MNSMSKIIDFFPNLSKLYKQQNTKDIHIHISVYPGLSADESLYISVIHLIVYETEEDQK